jgi:hypothetical protein
MFEPPKVSESKFILFLKRGFVVIFVLLGLIGAVASYRAYVQVRELEIRANQELKMGSDVSISLVTSGRTTVDVRVDLIQQEHSTTLFNMQLRGSELAFFDPRTRRGTKSITVTKAQLAGFQSGRALIRATAIGRPQWGRLPPPTVADFPIEIMLDNFKQLY